jgi:hypothetical protein
MPLVKMANDFLSNGTSNQIEQKKMTSMITMTNDIMVKWEISC